MDANWVYRSSIFPASFMLLRLKEKGSPLVEAEPDSIGMNWMKIYRFPDC